MQTRSYVGDGSDVLELEVGSMVLGLSVEVIVSEELKSLDCEVATIALQFVHEESIVTLTIQSYKIMARSHSSGTNRASSRIGPRQPA
jgi:hypothetical protein